MKNFLKISGIALAIAAAIAAGGLVWKKCAAPPQPEQTSVEIHSQFGTLQDSLSAYQQQVVMWQERYIGLVAEYALTLAQLDTLKTKQDEYFLRQRRYLRDLKRDYEVQKVEIDTLKIIGKLLEQ